METKVKVIATVINDLHYDQRMIRICSSLQRSGYAVTLLGRKRTREPLPERTFEQIRLGFLINSGPLFYAFYNLRLFVFLLFQRFDIIHAVDLDTLPAAALAAKLRGKKVVYDAHEYFTEVPELLNRPRIQSIWKWIEKRFLPMTHMRMTVGGELAKQFELRHNLHFHIIRNVTERPERAADKAAVDHPPVLDRPYILYQGALNAGRGLELLIKTMPEIPIDLVVLGSGDLDEKLRTLARKSGVSERIHFKGMLEPQALQPWTEGAFLGYNLSEQLGLSYFYSLNNKFFDYIHAALPALTNDFPEYRALNEEIPCVHLLDHEQSQLIEAVKLLVNDKQYYDDLKKSCLIAKEQWCWKVEEKKLLKAYDSLND